MPGPNVSCHMAPAGFKLSAELHFGILLINNGGHCSYSGRRGVLVGVTGFEPATSASRTQRSSQAEPHPDYFLPAAINPAIAGLAYSRHIRLPSRSTIINLHARLSIFAQHSPATFCNLTMAHSFASDIISRLPQSRSAAANWPSRQWHATKIHPLLLVLHLF